MLIAHIMFDVRSFALRLASVPDQSHHCDTTLAGAPTVLSHPRCRSRDDRLLLLMRTRRCFFVCKVVNSNLLSRKETCRALNTLPVKNTFPALNGIILSRQENVSSWHMAPTRAPPHPPPSARSPLWKPSAFSTKTGYQLDL